MFDFRAPYRPLMRINTILKDENEKLKTDLEQTKFMLKYTEELNSLLREQLKQISDRANLEKRVADLEQGKKLFLLDDNSTPIKSFTLTGKLTVMDEPAEEKLEVGKWYHTLDYTVDELRKLLPVGTTIFVEKDVIYDSIDTEPPTRAKICKVKDIIRGNFKFKALIDINEGFLREWFQIAKEN